LHAASDAICTTNQWVNKETYYPLRVLEFFSVTVLLGGSAEQLASSKRSHMTRLKRNVYVGYFLQFNNTPHFCSDTSSSVREIRVFARNEVSSPCQIVAQVIQKPKRLSNTLWNPVVVMI